MLSWGRNCPSTLTHTEEKQAWDICPWPLAEGSPSRLKLKVLVCGSSWWSFRLQLSSRGSDPTSLQTWSRDNVGVTAATLSKAWPGAARHPGAWELGLSSQAFLQTFHLYWPCALHAPAGVQAPPSTCMHWGEMAQLCNTPTDFQIQEELVDAVSVFWISVCL